MRRRTWKGQHWKWIRLAVQLVCLIFLPSVYASSFTAVKQVFSALGQGTPLEWSEFTWNFAVTAGVTIVFGRIFCGYACAFGMLGDVVYGLSQWIQKKCSVKKRFRWKMDEKISEKLSLMKYVVLLLLLTMCFSGSETMINENSPWTVFSLILSGHFSFGSYLVGTECLLLVLVGMAAKERFFCQYLCPMGAIYSLLPVLPTGLYHRDSTKCPEKCSACQKNCPVDLKLEAESMRQGECIRCGRCAQICPRNNIKLDIKRRIHP